MAEEKFERGDRCTNQHPAYRFTCPNCYTDHQLDLDYETNAYIRCSCGAPLVFSTEQVTEYVCHIAYEHEEEENCFDDAQ